MINVADCREDFPIFKRKINGKGVTYLDSTATTQKPQSVIDAISRYYEESNANVHRSVYALGNEATEIYEESRKNVADFICSKREEVVFTRNTTESLNLLSFTLEPSLKRGDRILVSYMEHHSNILPWMRLEEKGVEMEYVDLDDEGHLDIEDFKKKLTKNTKIVSITHESNVLGTINPVVEIGKMVKDNGSIFIVDAAQSVPHMPFRVDENFDFVAFSGHKMLGPMGIGVLYGKYDLLKKIPPFNRGGEMIKDVDFHTVSFEDPPIKFEAGTPNVAGAVGLSAAVDYLKKIGMENVRSHEMKLMSKTLESLENMKYVTYYGPRNVEERGGIVSFNVKNNISIVKKLQESNLRLDPMYHSHDVASYLDEKNVYIRSGHHCAQPLTRFLKIKGTARASFYIYNTLEDVDYLIESLGEISVQ